MDQHRSILDIYCEQMSRSGTSKQLSPAETQAYFTSFEEACQELEACSGEEREKALKKKAKLIEKITTSCLAYVLRLANNYTKGSDDKELLLELLAEGNVGLCIAVNKYDYRRGVPFHNYASNWIKANYQNVIKANKRLVKNSDTTSVYYQGFDEGQRLPDALHETVEDHSGDVEKAQTIASVRKHLEKVDPLSQLVYRLCRGFVAERDFKYTQVGKMFGEGFSAGVCKKHYEVASGEISMALVSSSTNSSGMLCDGSTLHV